MCHDSDCLLTALIGIILFFAFLLLFLLRTSKKKQEELLSLTIQKVWQDYAIFSQPSCLSIADVLLGLRRDHSLTRFSLLIRSLAGQESQVNLGTYNREYTFSIENKKYTVTRKLSFRSKLALIDEQKNEIMKFESTGLLGVSHHFFNSQYDFKSKHFWAKMSSGYQYQLNDRQVGFCHPLFGNKNYGQLLVLDAKIPIEFRVFILIVNWMGL